MSVERFDIRSIAPQPWKNGAGLTREIAFGGASGTDFDWRLSVAEVERNAPFSAFPGIDRCITLLQGAGMRLRAVDGSVDHLLTTPLAPFSFAGDVPLEATLLDGACNDFNVMTRRGHWRSEVGVHRRAATLADADATLLLCTAGEWAIDALRIAPIQALLWRAPRDEIRARPTGDSGALLCVRLCHDRMK